MFFSRMLELFAVGIVMYGIALIMYVYFRDYVQMHSVKESFMNPEQVFTDKVTPGENEDGSKLAPGPAFDTNTEQILGTNAMDMQTARANWGKMTSEACYRSDKGEVLKKTRNYSQRTNNYPRTHPDSCSAPNHEFLGTFYSPFNGVGSTPERGRTIPPTATCLRQ